MRTWLPDGRAARYRREVRGRRTAPDDGSNGEDDRSIGDWRVRPASGRVLDLDGIPRFGAARPIGRRHTCRCDISLGISKPAKAAPNPQIWTGAPRRPRNGAISPGIRARRVNRHCRAIRFRITGCPLPRHARLSKGLASRGGQSSCSLPRAPRRDWGIRPRHLLAAAHRTQTLPCRSSGRRPCA